MAMKLDEVDLLIIALLREDARLSLRDLGSRVNLSAPAVAARLKRLEEAKIIEAYRAVICKEKFGLALEALIRIKVLPIDAERFIDSLQDEAMVLYCYKITGDYSYEISVACTDTKALNAFIAKLNQKFGATQTSVVLNKEIALRSPFAFKTSLSDA